nr:aminoglycoside phosphotransferase family protein [Ruegeria faecimaris]
MYGGRTNQVWKVLGDDSDQVLKLYRSDLENPLFRNDPALEAACLRALASSGVVPRLRATGQHDNGYWVFYDHAQGTPWRSDPAPVARLLHRLHSLNPNIENAPTGKNGSADLAEHGQSILAMCTSDRRAQLEKMQPQHHILRSDHTCLIHGDPVAGNILVASSGLTLIDWQCPAVGDPCEDLALFLSPAMQYLYRGAVLTVDEQQSFLSAYDRQETVNRYRSLRRWYGWRMAAYCLWRTEHGAPDYEQGLELELAAL